MIPLVLNTDNLHLHIPPSSPVKDIIIRRQPILLYGKIWLLQWHASFSAYNFALFVIACFKLWVDVVECESFP